MELSKDSIFVLREQRESIAISLGRNSGLYNIFPQSVLGRVLIRVRGRFRDRSEFRVRVRVRG